MIMKIDNIFLDKLAAQAKESPRLRSIMMILSVFVVRVIPEFCSEIGKRKRRMVRKFGSGLNKRKSAA